MNLTDDQKDLLRTLVAVYQTGETSQFTLVPSHSGSTLIYQRGYGVPVTFDDADFHQLAQERFITLSHDSIGDLCGKPTKLGIETVIADFATSGRQTVTEHAIPLVRRLGGSDSPSEGTTHPRISGTTPLPTIQRPSGIEGSHEQTEADGGLGNREDRYRMVDAFVLRCNQETRVKVFKKHIWRAAGHSSPRQFQYWKAGGSKTTRADEENFQRILSMNPSAFVAFLLKKGIIEP